MGGIVAQRYGWRSAFYVVGLPGVVLAVLSELTLREPPRGHSEPRAGSATADAGGDALADVVQAAPSPTAPSPTAPSPTAPSLGAVLRRLLSRPSFIHLALGATLASFAGYGVNAFAPPYFIRTFGLNLALVGTVFGIVGGIGAALGVMGGGLISDAVGRRDKRWYVWTPAIGLAVSVPIYIAAYLLPSWQVAALLLLPGGAFAYTYLGPSFGVMHNMVSPQMRATATALLFLVINFIGLGLGPTVVGVLSDLYAGQAFHAAAGLGHAGFAALCPGGRPGMGATAALTAACHHASATGVRWAIVTGLGVYLWAAVHYALAARTLRADLES